MATTAPSPNDLTRQQLDELDDLLQRMLSLPLNPPESYTPPPSPQPFAPPMPMPTPAAAPAPMAAPVVREMPAPAPAPAPASMPRAFVPPAPEPVEPPQVWTPPAPAPMPAPRPATAPVPQPLPAPIIERPAPTRSLPPAPEPLPYAAPHSEPVPILFAPFVGFNAALNWSLGLFGFPGRVLRSGFVKTLFGLAGIGLLAYTGLKVAQIHGLITLPQELPWPPKQF